MDTCYSCLWGVSTSQLERLQRVRNTSVRIVTRRKKYDNIIPILCVLHWPVNHRLLPLKYQCTNNTASKYIKELIHHHQPTHHLWSATPCRFRFQVLSRTPTRSTLGQGLLQHYTNCTKLWNRVLRFLKESSSKTVFRKALKTHLFY